MGLANPPEPSRPVSPSNLLEVIGQSPHLSLLVSRCEAAGLRFANGKLLHQDPGFSTRIGTFADFAVAFDRGIIRPQSSLSPDSPAPQITYEPSSGINRNSKTIFLDGQSTQFKFTNEQISSARAFREAIHQLREATLAFAERNYRRYWEHLNLVVPDNSAEPLSVEGQKIFVGLSEHASGNQEERILSFGRGDLDPKKISAFAGKGVVTLPAPNHAMSWKELECSDQEASWQRAERLAKNGYTICFCQLRTPNDGVALYPVSVFALGKLLIGEEKAFKAHEGTRYFILVTRDPYHENNREAWESETVTPNLEIDFRLIQKVPISFDSEKTITPVQSLLLQATLAEVQEYFVEKKLSDLKVLAKALSSAQRPLSLRSCLEGIFGEPAPKLNCIEGDLETNERFYIELEKLVSSIIVNVSLAIKPLAEKSMSRIECSDDIRMSAMITVLCECVDRLLMAGSYGAFVRKHLEAYKAALLEKDFDAGERTVKALKKELGRKLGTWSERPIQIATEQLCEAVELLKPKECEHRTSQDRIFMIALKMSSLSMVIGSFLGGERAARRQSGQLFAHGVKVRVEEVIRLCLGVSDEFAQLSGPPADKENRRSKSGVNRLIQSIKDWWARRGKQ